MNPFDLSLGAKIGLLISSLIINLLATNMVYADAEMGAWGEVVEWPHVPVSASNLPDGRILTWSGTEPTNWAERDERTYSTTWDPSTGKFIEIVHPSHNMFCAHQVMTEDGQVFVNGGRNNARSKWTSLFDHLTNTWKQIESMVSGGRWYPSSLALGDGKIFTAMGTGTAVGLKHPEIWSEGSGWRLMNTIDFADMHQARDGLTAPRKWWPHLNLTPRGDIFHFWDTKESFLINTDGAGGYQYANSITDVDTHKPGVMINYDVGKLLVTGSNQGSWSGRSTTEAFTIDLNQTNPVIKATDGMHHKRKYHHLIPLPTGEVMVLGGNTSGTAFSDSGSVYDTEIWNPNTGQWRLTAPITVPRNYHSTALLLTDGRVLAAGGGYGTQPEHLTINHQDGQVFTPPYLFNAAGGLAPRPSITNGPKAVEIGTTVNISTGQVIDQPIAYFSLIKMSSTTHSVNTDVRFLKPAFTRTGANNYAISVPPNPNVAVPGYWMLFAVDANGVPSKAHVLRIGRDEQSAPPPKDNTIKIASIKTTPQASGAITTFTASATGNGPLEYQWNFGDGSTQEFSTARTASHRFSGPGHYVVIVTVRDSNGNDAQETFTQLVHKEPTARAPLASSGLIEYVAQHQVWNVNPDNDSVSVIDTRNPRLIKTIKVGTTPRSLAIAPDGRVWVVNKSSASITVIDPIGLNVVKTVRLDPGTQPHGLVIGTESAYVALEATGHVLRLNPSNGKIQARKYLGQRPRHLALDATESTLWVSRFITPPLPLEDSASPVVDDGTQVYGGEVVLLDTQTLAVEETVVLQHSDRSISEHTGPGVPNYLGPAVISPSGDKAWVPSKQDNILAGGLRGGVGMMFDQTVRAVTSKIDVASATEELASRVDHDNASVANHAAFGPYGLYLFTALEGNRAVAVTDVISSIELLRIPVGKVPQSVMVSAEGTTLYVHNFLDRSVGLYDIAKLVQQGEERATEIATVSTVSNETLSANVLRGKRLFYDATDDRLAHDNYMSCASCHNEGDHDGRVWDMTDFGEGLRNTISLKGHAGLAHGPLHWSGNFDEVQDFEGQMRHLSGGRGFMTDKAFFLGTREFPLGKKKAGINANLDALAAYVSSLKTVGTSPYRHKDGGLTAEANVGKSLFDGTCTACHRGRNFTDSALGRRHDIGTLKPSSGNRLFNDLIGIDTPSLLGLWATAPYLHDGRAKTLRQAIKAHHNVSLNTDETRKLVAYMRQIDDVETTGLIHHAATRLGDFNGDRRADIVWRHALTGENRLFFMRGSRITANKYLNTLTDSHWIIAGVGDFNNNGKDDLLLRNTRSGQNWIYLMRGSTIAKRKSIKSLADTDWQVVGIGDFDGRGKDDILWRHARTGENRIFFMNGSRVMANKRINYVRDRDWHVAGTGDFNGDRKTDILWRHVRSGENVIYLMKHTRIITKKRVNTHGDRNWKVHGIADFNNDGKADILWRHHVTGINRMTLMRGTKIMGTKKINRVSDLQWQITGTGDFDRDGRADILWRHAKTGVNWVYLMEGARIKKSKKVNTMVDPSWQVAGIQ